MGVGFGGGAPYVHPTFLYESLWNLLGLILVTVFYKKKKFHGQVFLFYAIWYGAGRAFVEGLRTDSLMLGSFRVSQLLSVVICLAGIVLMVIGMNRAPRVSYASAAAENADSAPVSPDEKADGEAEPICDDAENVPEQSQTVTELMRTAQQTNPPMKRRMKTAMRIHRRINKWQK